MSTTDNCCQRAKVYGWVAQPGLFAKCHDHVALYRGGNRGGPEAADLAAGAAGESQPR